MRKTFKKNGKTYSLKAKIVDIEEVFTARIITKMNALIEAGKLWCIGYKEKKQGKLGLFVVEEIKK